MRTSPPSRLMTILTLATLAASGCSRQPATDAELRPADLGTTKPAFQCGSIYLGGQPTESDLPMLRDLGIRTVINLRKPAEVDWDEPAAVEGLGMRYVALPFRTADELTDELLDEALGVLRDSSQHPVLVHCASNNRTGAVWYAHRILHDGLSPEAALAEAKAGGLRTMEYLEPVEAYIEKRSGAGAGVTDQL